MLIFFKALLDNYHGIINKESVKESYESISYQDDFDKSDDKISDSTKYGSVSQFSYYEYYNIIISIPHYYSIDTTLLFYRYHNVIL